MRSPDYFDLVFVERGRGRGWFEVERWSPRAVLVYRGSL